MIFLDRVRKILKYQISWKSVQWVPRRSIRADGQIDRHDKANSHCSRFCERVQNSCDGQSATLFVILVKHNGMLGCKMK